MPPAATKASLQGHLLALLTTLLWGTTLVVTKSLLTVGFQPVEIIFFRFLVGWLTLFLIKPHVRLPFSLAALKRDRWLILAGLFGVAIYYLAENTAALYTTASNTSLLVTLSPLFTALIGRYLLKTGKLTRHFICGALICFGGVFLVVFNGNFLLQLSPVGDLLAISAGFFWSIYCHILARINHDNPEQHVVIRMQRIFLYGLIFLLPCMPLFGFQLRPQLLASPAVIFGLLYLGICATAICFIFWNNAIAKIGVVNTSVYIYLVPLFTITFSMIFLKERLTWVSAIGALLIVCGLLVSEGLLKKRGQRPAPSTEEVP